MELKRSTSFLDPMASAVRWSTALICTSRTDPPVTPSDVFPPAASTRRPNGDASNASRSFAGDLSDVGFVKMPMFFVNCWYTSGTRPPEYRSLLVPGDFRTRAHVRRGEDLAVLVDLDLLPGADPRLEGAVRELAPVGGAPVGELVHAVVEADENRRARAVDGDECRDLVAPGRADESVRAGAGLLRPDPDHRADGPVVVDDRGPVERVPAHREAAVRVARLHLGLLLGRAPGDDRGGLDRVPHDLVRDDVHGQLRVAERVRGALDGDERGAERLGDVGARVELLADHRLHLLVLALGAEDGVEGVVRLLLLRGGVEGRPGGAVLAAALDDDVSHRRLRGGLLRRARGATGRRGRADGELGRGDSLRDRRGGGERRQRWRSGRRRIAEGVGWGGGRPRRRSIERDARSERRRNVACAVDPRSAAGEGRRVAARRRASLGMSHEPGRPLFWSGSASERARGAAECASGRRELRIK
eukprot:29185-Pelagococcus_subviridis.AAC.2